MLEKTVTALALFSGGLDSILACRIIAAQGIHVKAVRFVTPFFGHALLQEENLYIDATKKNFGIDVMLHDISEKYLTMLKKPAHGYGKNFNPCLDCKILLATEIKNMLPRFNGSFVISGEVIGQRPMSQRRDTMRVVERDSGCEGILLRPLCAKSMKPTTPELEGLVDRDKLLGFKGRGRKDQMELAAQLGIKDYPSPAGGCLLTDPIISRRIRRYYEETDDIRAADILLLGVGRQYRLPGGGMIALGRDQAENKKISSLTLTSDLLLKMKDRPGPTALLRHSAHPDDIKVAAGLVVRYGKKIPGADLRATVAVISSQGQTALEVSPLDDQISRPWNI